MLHFKDLYQVLPEHINENSMIQQRMSYLLRYDDFEFEVFNNAIEVTNFKHNYSYYITTFTNGLMYDNRPDFWWTIRFDEIQTKEDLFNFSIQHDIFDLDLELIRYIECLMKLVQNNLYNEKNNLKVCSAYGL